jgi:hypothetical protein
MTPTDKANKKGCVKKGKNILLTQNAHTGRQSKKQFLGKKSFLFGKWN